MYGKIFDSMYDGTISANWQGLVTFQQMIVLCDADGVIDMTPPALSRRTGIPLEIIEKGIKYLEAPDPYSRTPDHDGARIVRLDEHRPWGWFIVNHGKYRSMVDADTKRQQTRERVRKHRAKKASKSSQNVTPSNAQKRHTDTDTDKVKKTNAQIHGFDAWWDVYPRKKEKKKALDIWKRKNLAKRADELIAKLKEQVCDCESFNRSDKTKIAYPTTYLNGERYDDDIDPIQSNPQQSKTDIKSEILARISRGVQNGYDWKSPEAEAVFNKMRQLPGGVPWNGNEWQIKQAISEVI